MNMSSYIKELESCLKPVHSEGNLELRVKMKVVGQIRRVDGRQVTYGEFKKKYMMGNEPVLLTGLMDQWSACQDWVTDNGQPNLSFFSDHFGSSQVQIADCDRREFTDQKRMEMTITEFMKYWQNLNGGSSCMQCDWNKNNSSLLYLKDWHFVKEYPEYNAYTTPMLFSDDWLNLYLDTHCMHDFHGIEDGQCEVNCSDYRFVYMGPKGTWTPLHADVFRSYSWSANICGKKIWHFLSPSQAHLLFDRYMKNSVYDIYGNVSPKQFPGFSETSWLECIQERNEIIFVPSGWYHQVKNLEDTISINHNWFNACNLSWVWNLLVKDYNETKEYIEDIRSIADDFESLCQRNLAANTGMNFDDFFIFATRMALVNLTQLVDLMQIWEIRHGKNCMELSAVDKMRQLLFNLVSICNVVRNMESIDYFHKHGKNKRNLEYTDVSSSDVVILKYPNFKELYDALEATYRLLHTPNVRNSNMDLVDGETGNNAPASTVEGSQQSPCNKSSSKAQGSCFDDMFSVLSQHLKPQSICSNLLIDGCWTEHCKVTITSPTQLIYIIDDAIAPLRERCDLESLFEEWEGGCYISD